MSENETVAPVEETGAENSNETSETAETTTDEVADAETNVAEAEEEISYHAVEKDGDITAIWEMQGQKHIRTIHPRSSEGQKIFSLFTSEIHDTDAGTSENATTEEATA